MDNNYRQTPFYLRETEQQAPNMARGKSPRPPADVTYVNFIYLVGAGVIRRAQLVPLRALVLKDSCLRAGSGSGTAALGQLPAGLSMVVAGTGYIFLPQLLCFPRTHALRTLWRVARTLSNERRKLVEATRIGFRAPVCSQADASLWGNELEGFPLSS